MLILSLPAEYQPRSMAPHWTPERAALERRLNDSVAQDGYRRALRCEWPQMAHCGGMQCDGEHWCEGCERAYRSWEINARINWRAARTA